MGSEMCIRDRTYTEPGIKGDTATNTMKPATIDTGAEVRVPLFIDTGDKIRWMFKREFMWKG